MEMSKYEEGESAFDAEDYEKAMKIMLPLAKEGDVKAQLSVASMYFVGLGVKQDYIHALKWYLLAAEECHPVAQHSLTHILHSLENIEEAIQYLLEAEKQNIFAAQYYLGDIFTGAYHTSSDILKKFNVSFDEALKRYHRAGEGGFYYAYHRLGEIYERNEGVEKNEIEAVKFYRKSAEQGYVSSQRVLARAYQNGLLGLPIDLEQAQYWLNKVQANMESGIYLL